MNFTTNKENGNFGLGIAIAYFTSHGYIVSIPLNDTCEKYSMYKVYIND